MQKALYGLLAVIMAAGMKYGYSRATSEDLSWMLGPVAALVESLTGAAFMKEAGVGYVCHAKEVAIVPACAGVNFLIAAFGMTSLAWICAMRQKIFLPLCIPAALAAAYGTTLCANTLRIILSIYLYHADIYTALVTPERIHRLAGVAVYFICLCLLYLGARKIMAWPVLFGGLHQKDDAGCFKDNLLASLAPLLWYLAVAVAAPAFNQAYRKNPALFWEHAGFVFTVSFLLFIVMFIGVMCYKTHKSK